MLKKEKWIWEWERRAHLLIVYQLAMTYTFDKFWPWLRIPVLFISHGRVVNLYFSSVVIEQSKLLASRIQRSRDFLKSYRQEMSRENKALQKYCAVLGSVDWPRQSVKQLISLLNQYRKIYRQHGVIPIRTLNKVGPMMIEDFLRKKYGHQQTVNWLPILFAATKASAEQKSEEDLLKLAQSIDGLKKLSEKNSVVPSVKKFLKKYQWLPCGYANELPLKEKDVLNKIKSLFGNKPSPAWRLKQLARERSKNAISRKILIKKLRLPPSIINLIEALSEFTYYKDSIRMNYNQLHYYSGPLFKETAGRLGINSIGIRYLTVPEIISALQKGKVSKGLISARQKHYVCYSYGKKISIIIGQAARLKEKEAARGSNKSTGIIKGTGACLGRVQGVVKIIKQASQVKNFSARAILVTPMTTPELVPAVKKAKAIVTDEGGITCHAAIISRELGIPCVIGTKIATKVLKDGDRVEVDAFKGIVRKIQ